MSVDAPSPSEPVASLCKSFVDALPSQVADQPRRPVDSPDSLAAAWGNPAIVLRCGVAAPSEYDEEAACTTVDGVDWFIPESELEDHPTDLTMTVVNRAAYVEVRMPADYWPPATTLADLSGVVAAQLERTGHCS